MIKLTMFLESEGNFRGRLNGIMLGDYSIGNCCQIFTTVSSVFSVLISASKGSKSIKQIISIKFSKTAKK